MNQRISCTLCNGKNGIAKSMFNYKPKSFIICNICVSHLYNHKINISLASQTPASIYEKLSSSVKGQDWALKDISVNIYKQLLAVNSQIDPTFARKIKSNSLIIGDTGTGKTYILELAARILNVPFLVVDTTSITAAGYIGDDVDNILSRLIKLANDNIQLAQFGIVFLDELDKIASSSTSTHTKDIGGQSVQQELLKILDGAIVEVNLDGKKQTSFRYAKINTANILFIGAGCFDGIQKLLRDQTSSGELILKTFNSEDHYSIRMRNALRKFGFIPEFLARFSSVVELKLLNIEDLKEIIQLPGGKLFYYIKLFNNFKVSIKMTDEAIYEIASIAYKTKIGARSINGILDKIFHKLLYSIDSLEPKIIIDKIDIIRSQEFNFQSINTV